MSDDRDPVDRTPLPSVRDVLALPEILAGAPQLLAGETGQEREVRWAHVASDSTVASLLDGGELILVTGRAWPRSEKASATFAKRLIEAGVAAIVLELGRGISEAPKALVAECARHSVPLVALHREVRFVQITQRVHQRILAAQNEALEARAKVHAMLTELGLNRSPVDYVVEQLAETLSAPVVLEDLGHRVIAFAGGATAALDPWLGDGDPRLPEGSARVPVEARGTRWGHLTALPGPPHPAGRHTVLELGAFALALGRLADAEGEQWLQIGSKRVFEAMLSGRYRADTELEAQLIAAGLPLAHRATFALTLRGTGAFGGHETLERATLETALRRAVAPEGRVLVTDDDDASGGLLLALVSLPGGDARAGHGAEAGTPVIAHRLARELDMLVPEQTPPSWRAHLALGVPGVRLGQLVASLEQLRSVGRLTPSAEVGRVAVQQAERQPLPHLIRSLAGNPALQQFALDALGPLIEHDREPGPGRPGDLLRVLAAYTSSPTNRSLAARRARLSRSVFYQRLELIEQLLGIDLSDGETIATLAVALLAHGD